MMAFSQLEAELMEFLKPWGPWGSWPTKIWWTAKIAKILDCEQQTSVEDLKLQSLLMPWVIPCSPYIYIWISHGQETGGFQDAKSRDHHVSSTYAAVCFTSPDISRCFNQFQPLIILAASFQVRLGSALATVSAWNFSCQLSWCVFLLFPPLVVWIIENQAG